MSKEVQARRHIGLNAHLLSLTRSYRGAGINGHIYQLLRHLPAVEECYRYSACLYEPAFGADETPLFHCERSHWDTRSPLRRVLWEQTRLAGLSRSFDLLHGLAYAVPLAAACPTVVTIHDLSFLRFPSAFRPFNRWYLSWITRVSTRRAARVIAVSESTRQDVIALCKVPGERVVAIPNGVGEEFCPSRSTDVAAFRAQRGLPDNYILFLGTLEPRKNVVRLVEAYARWKERQSRSRAAGDRGTRLVIAGGKGWFYRQIFERVTELGLADDVIFPGFIPADELVWWYRAADLFVYPSLFEGFGLPVLEAMASGTPVITSTASSLPEVAGDAALLVDPQDTGALAEAIERILGDPVLAARLREQGPCRAARFSWGRTAAETVQVYHSVLGDAP